MNLSKIWQDNVVEYGEYPILIYEGEAYTNVRLDEVSSQLAHALRQMGVEKGNRVLVTMPNCPEVVIAFGGVIKSGSAVVPVMPLLQAQELRYILEDCTPKVVLTTNTLFSKVREASKDLPSTPQIFTLEEASGEANALQAAMQKAPTTAPEGEIHEDDDAALLYTAGTTGAPKGVTLTHKNLYSNAVAASKKAEILKLKTGRVSLSILPFSHAFGYTMMNVAFILGDKNVLLPHFEPVKVLEAIEKYKVTHSAMVPAMFHALYNHPDADNYDTSTFFACISGSAALPKPIAEGFQKKFGCIILEGYGLSEAAPIVTATDPRQKIKPGSVGQPLPGIEVAVVDENDNRLPANEVGELIVSGPNVLKGYHGKPEETGKVLKDGWLYTGDMARVDEEDYVFIVDRKKDVIIRGGFNIYPKDLEELLLSHSEVSEAAVIGVPSEKMGEEVAAYIVKKRRSEIQEEELITFAQEHLAKYKTPRFLKIVGYLPKNVIGKTDKKKLREWAKEFHTASK
ncbi:class I adenylate-forming enzyme family protein [Salicibibacter kimchii]|uniref:Long-chain fatty acid--CoA ligase n=1 Tax=Salicibibacter kimchii TaxID=2099786 RepID=A0A345C0Y1_9BACI|nr:long-chain-fatty-acid--CoA ligase [Salicibibacter kimchii]AXF56862.1 long-chain fatty acid--CoA ligase [Salicibibacter kimchii]